MARAGHANMSTTNQYVHLAGTVFRDEAAALERRLLGTGVSTDLSEPQNIPEHPAPLEQAETRFVGRVSASP